MHWCVCVCMHVCVTLCLYVHMFVCVCVYLYVYLYVCVCVCTVPSRSLHAAILQPGPNANQHGSVLAVHHLKYSHRFLVVLVHRACCQHMEAVFCVMYINTSIQITWESADIFIQVCKQHHTFGAIYRWSWWKVLFLFHWPFDLVDILFNSCICILDMFRNEADWLEFSTWVIATKVRYVCLCRDRMH